MIINLLKERESYLLNPAQEPLVQRDKAQVACTTDYKC